MYLASTPGTNPKIKDAAAELGQWIGANGHTLIYGGSESGLMGLLAKSVLDAGGKVIGIEPQFFIDSVKQLDGLTELIPTVDMRGRKAKMIEMGYVVEEDEDDRFFFMHNFNGEGYKTIEIEVANPQNAITIYSYWGTMNLKSVTLCY